MRAKLLALAILLLTVLAPASEPFRELTVKR